jgi:hypothetical protein
MLKNLRIAVTALSLTACVLLIALWARSTHIIDDAQSSLFGLQRVSLHSGLGGLQVVAYFDDTIERFPENISSNPVPDFMRQQRVSHWNWGEQLASSESFHGYYVSMPYWFPVLFSVTLATLLWLPVKRFSLRTLLIATTLVAVGLGIIVVSS